MAKSKWEEVKDKLVLIEGWARDGLTNKEIAIRLGIGETTFYKIINEHSEVSEVLKKGKEVIDYQVENALLKNALEGNVTAQIYWLNNRKPKQWKNKRENTESNNEEITKVEELLNKIKEEAENGNNG
ncbi:MAG: helix-turn-helix domain-containing protein [Clostridia bacterium]|nr:helix-turn-helix domain-containing protein [Clostridia bacterium]